MKEMFIRKVLYLFKNKIELKNIKEKNIEAMKAVNT